MRLRSLYASLVVAAALPAAAGAATLPAPDCRGIAVSDAAGDVEFSGEGSKDALDISAVWFRYRDGELTAFLRIKDLKLDEPSSSTGERWAVFFKLPGSGDTRYVAAKFMDAGPGATSPDLTFKIGHSHEPGAIHDEGNTTGRVYEGKDGLIEMVVPDVGPNEEGRLLENVHAMTYANVPQIDVHGASTAEIVDQTEIVKTTVASCPEETTEPAPVDAPVPAAAPVPAPAPGSAPAAFAARSASAPLVDLWSAPAVDFLEPVRLRGRVWPATAGDAVELITGDAARQRVVARTVADAGGWFSVLVRPTAGAVYRARSGGAVSAPVHVAVRPLVSVDLRERRGGRLAVSGKVSPATAGTVSIQRRVGGRFVTVRRLAVSKGRFAGTLAGAERGQYRAVFTPARGGTASYSAGRTWR